MDDAANPFAAYGGDGGEDDSSNSSAGNPFANTVAKEEEEEEEMSTQSAPAGTQQQQQQQQRAFSPGRKRRVVGHARALSTSAIGEARSGGRNKDAGGGSVGRPRSTQSWSTARVKQQQQQIGTGQQRQPARRATGSSMLIGSRSASNVTDHRSDSKQQQQHIVSRRCTNAADEERQTTAGNNVSFRAPPAPSTASPLIQTHSDPNLYGGNAGLRKRSSTVAGLGEAMRGASKAPEETPRRKRSGSLWKRLGGAGGGKSSSKKSQGEEDRDEKAGQQEKEEQEAKRAAEACKKAEETTKKERKKREKEEAKRLKKEKKQEKKQRRKKRKRATTILTAAELKERQQYQHDQESSEASSFTSCSDSESDTSTSSTKTGDSASATRSSGHAHDETSSSSGSGSATRLAQPSNHRRSPTLQIGNARRSSSPPSASSSASSPASSPAPSPLRLVKVEPKRPKPVALQSNAVATAAARHEQCDVSEREKEGDRKPIGSPLFVDFGVEQVEKGARTLNRFTRQHDALNSQLRQASHHMDATAKFFRTIVQDEGNGEEGEGNGKEGEGNGREGEGKRKEKKITPLPLPVPRPPSASATTEQDEVQHEDEDEDGPWTDDEAQAKTIKHNVRRYMLGEPVVQQDGSSSSGGGGKGDRSSPGNTKLTITPIRGEAFPRITMETQVGSSGSASPAAGTTTPSSSSSSPPTEVELDEALRRISEEKTLTQQQRGRARTEIQRLVEQGRSMLTTIPEEEEEGEEREAEGEEGQGEAEGERAIGEQAEEEALMDEPDDLEHDVPLFFDSMEESDFVDTSLLNELIGNPHATTGSEDSSSSSSSDDDDFTFFLGASAESSDDEDQEEGGRERRSGDGRASKTLRGLDRALGRDCKPSQTEAARSMRLQATTQRLSERLHSLEIRLSATKEEQAEQLGEKEAAAREEVPSPSPAPVPAPAPAHAPASSKAMLEELASFYDMLEELIQAIDHDAVDRSQQADETRTVLQTMLKRMARAFAEQRRRTRRERKNPAIARIYEALRLLDEKHRTLAQRVAERLSTQNSHIYQYNKEQTKALRSDLADQGRRMAQLSKQVAALQRQSVKRQERFTGCLTTLFDAVGALATSLDETRAELGLFRDAYLQQQRFYRQQIEFQERAHRQSMAAFRSVQQLVEGEVTELRSQNELERIKFDLLRKHVLEQEQEKLRLMERQQQKRRQVMGRKRRHHQHQQQQQPHAIDGQRRYLRAPNAIHGAWVDEVGDLVDTVPSSAYSDDDDDELDGVDTAHCY